MKDTKINLKKVCALKCRRAIRAENAQRRSSSRSHAANLVATPILNSTCGVRSVTPPSTLNQPSALFSGRLPYCEFGPFVALKSIALQDAKKYGVRGNRSP